MEPMFLFGLLCLNLDCTAVLGSTVEGIRFLAEERQDLQVDIIQQLCEGGSESGPGVEFISWLAAHRATLQPASALQGLTQDKLKLKTQTPYPR
jgi:hypothetical protein